MILFGVPEEGLAKAGVKISSKIHLVEHSRYIYMLKVSGGKSAHICFIFIFCVNPAM